MPIFKLVLYFTGTLGVLFMLYQTASMLFSAYCSENGAAKFKKGERRFAFFGLLLSAMLILTGIVWNLAVIFYSKGGVPVPAAFYPYCYGAALAQIAAMLFMRSMSASPVYALPCVLFSALSAGLCAVMFQHSLLSIPQYNFSHDITLQFLTISRVILVIDAPVLAVSLFMLLRSAKKPKNEIVEKYKHIEEMLNR